MRAEETNAYVLGKLLLELWRNFTKLLKAYILYQLDPDKSDQEKKSTCIFLTATTKAFLKTISDRSDINANESQTTHSRTCNSTSNANPVLKCQFLNRLHFFPASPFTECNSRVQLVEVHCESSKGFFII